MQPMVGFRPTNLFEFVVGLLIIFQIHFARSPSFKFRKLVKRCLNPQTRRCLGQRPLLPLT